MKKVLIVGVKNKGSLENSYLTALISEGYDVSFFDYSVILKKYIKLGKLGQIINTFFPVFAWQKKMNREFVIECKVLQPDYVFYFTNAPIFAGSILCVKTMYKSIKHILIWPDTPLNIEDFILNNANLYDLTATYSNESVKEFELARFNNVNWIPLAADDEMFKISNTYNNAFNFDIGFVGGWRPEREAVLSKVIKNFPFIKIAIYGPYWKRECKNTKLLPYILGSGLYEKELSRFFQTTKINLNIIDDTNYPSANMRFFEIPISKGLQLSSKCPEFSEIIKNKEHVLYFDNESEMIQQINWVLENEELAQKIRYDAFKLVSTDHLYKNRIKEIFKNV
jgi:spore maturation protein CgeB